MECLAELLSECCVCSYYCILTVLCCSVCSEKAKEPIHTVTPLSTITPRSTITKNVPLSSKL